ncbi:glycosyltransferase [Swingsia samuiensis]|uniref:Glycosyltransferase n=1 Tax=Swingsia samuiensis TaxID=1293412 RepID=A0A4Y6UKE7_9PROT|nr:glycosyltransferase [Swingsia samuiensis]QDH17118.1 glycosyltransferase [Swingsia samuiensis]
MREKGSDQPDLTGTTSRVNFSGYGHKVTDADRAQWRDVMNARAQEAFHRGQEFVKKGNLEDGIFWLERAHRMARKSPNVTWALALAYLSAGHLDESLVKLESLHQQYDLREAAFLEAVCLVNINQKKEALNRLGCALGRFHVVPEMTSLIEDLVKQFKRDGWCTLSNSGVLAIHTQKDIQIICDGKEVFSGKADGLYSLPKGWSSARCLEVKRGQKHLLGSPINIASITRCESLVRATASGLEGWLWYPADPDHVPTIHIGPQETPQIVSEYAKDVDSDQPLPRPRIFRIELRKIPARTKQVMIRDEHGRPLVGAPLNPDIGALFSRKRKTPAYLRPQPVEEWPVRPAIDRKSRGWAVIIPVYKDEVKTLACLRSVFATVGPDVSIIVIDDATPEPALAKKLDDLRVEKRITLIRHKENLGYPASVNDGLRLAKGRDVVLLNSDTLVFPKWLERLEKRMKTTDVGTLTPFSNDASILSYPSVKERNPIPSSKQAKAIDRLCSRLFKSEEARIELPTANGFCMAISAECLEETGLFREDVFSLGYGEENDFCLRASALGFRHYPAPDVFVAHFGSVSFGSSRKALITRNLSVLEALHPGYHALVGRFIRSDALGGLRRAIDAARVEKLRGSRPSILLIQHDAGGGVGKAVSERAADWEEKGYFVLSLRPTEDGCWIEPLQKESSSTPNMTFVLPQETSTFVALLKDLKLAQIEWHHLVGHAPMIRQLHEKVGVPYSVFVHDYMSFCPRISLLNGEGHYCGEPELSECENCINTSGSYLDESITVSKLLDRSQKEFQKAKNIMVPSNDTARRMKRHFPFIEPEVHFLEQDILEKNRAGEKGQLGADGILRICVVGGISRWKGYDVLLQMASEIKKHSLPIEIVLVGHTPDDEGLIAQGVKVTGHYQEEEAVSLIKQQKATIGFIPSISPETWCYALTLLWKSDLRVLCFNIGAQAERIQRTGRGMVLPLGMPIEMLLRFLLREIN